MVPMFIAKRNMLERYFKKTEKFYMVVFRKFRYFAKFGQIIPFLSRKKLSNPILSFCHFGVNNVI